MCNWPKSIINILIPMSVSVGLFAASVQAQIIIVPGPQPAATGAGNLEPPGSAVNGSSNPIATTPTQPSWDQKLPANNGGVDGCNSTRFKCIWPTGLFGHPNGAAVLDKDTGLTWQRFPSDLAQEWWDSGHDCGTLNVAGRKGWRLPFRYELASLLDMTHSGSPKLPLGHPFGNIQNSAYWSASPAVLLPEENPDLFAGYVNFSDGGVGSLAKTQDHFFWCVRGGGVAQ